MCECVTYAIPTETQTGPECICQEGFIGTTEGRDKRK